MKQIFDLNDLCIVALKRKAVFSNKFQLLRKPRPAAFVFHWPGVRILQAIDAGLFVYESNKDNHENV